MTYDHFTLKARRFLVALEHLCQEHQVLLSVSGYDGLQVWDLEHETGEPWCCTGMEDMTVPTDLDTPQAQE